jgi:acid phosphatase (class A)
MVGATMRLVRTARVSRAIDLSVLSAVLILVGACTLLPRAAGPGPAPEIRPGVLEGYLPKASRPDSLQLLPPPPTRGSARMAGDVAVSRAALRLRGTARWALARRDAVLTFPKAADAFECAAGLRVSKDRTPNLYQVLGRAETDARLSTRRAKKYYKRRRPFLLNGKPICTPGDKERLAKEGSYPSGHTTIGWAWALVLSELIPDRADRILLRGRQFGESRLVCNVHWNSDVEAGRTLAAAVVARLHGDPAFRAAMRAARREIAAARRRGPAPGAACKRQAEVLGRIHLYGR